MSVGVKFRELVDTDALHRMLLDLYSAARIPSAIIDMEGNILTGAGWQRICTEFHRVHPEAEKVCIASDTRIADEIKAGAPYVIYECPHGLVDSCCPIIIEGEHVANVFTGQFLHASTTAETIERFRQQAHRYGFDESAYLEALAEVPVFSLDEHRAMLGFLSSLAQQIASIGLSNRRAQEQALLAQESEQRFRLLMDSLDSVIYVADMDTYEIIFLNRYGRDQLGDAVGRRCWEALQSGQTGPCVFCSNPRLLDAEGTPTGLYTWEFQNTLNQRWYLMVDRAIRWTDGRMVRLEIATDITERKEADAANALLEARLQQAQKMEAIGTMAGGIAHDFNNILAIILGHGELLGRELPRSGPLRESLDDIVTASRRASEIVRQILTFSRQGTRERKTEYLCRLVEESARALRASIPSTVELVIEVPDRCHTDVGSCLQVDVVPSQIHQILLNLCANAVHAMDEIGRLEIRVEEVLIGEGGEQRHGLSPGAYELLTVSDTGCGMDAGILPQIFDPFFTTKAVGEGTGMGLSVVHGIVLAHGGHIIVESEPRKGTTFKVYFPSVENAAIEEAHQVEKLPRGQGNVLLVDDEVLLLKAMTRLLERLGYRVVPFSDGHDALEFLRADPQAVDVVITDQTMPGLTGAELTVRILEVRPELPVILCTGYSNLVTQDMVKGLGARALLDKPITAGVIAETLRDCLGVPPPHQSS